MITRRRVVPDPSGVVLNLLVAGAVEPGSTVLDMGAGLRGSYQPALAKVCSELTLLDAHQIYLEQNETVRLGLPNVKTVWGEAPGVLGALDKFDYVLGIDFLEHMERDIALATVEAAKKIASSKLILFVPEGSHPQHEDYYGMGGDHWQTHRSVWWAKDLAALGFDVMILEGYHALWREPTDDQNALWCVWRNS
jgi:hypothetical protein